MFFRVYLELWRQTDSDHYRRLRSISPDDTVLKREQIFMDIVQTFVVPGGVSALISFATLFLFYKDRKTNISVRPGFEWELLPGSPQHTHRRLYGKSDTSSFFIFGEPKLFVEVTNLSKFDIFVGSVRFPTNETETSQVFRINIDPENIPGLKRGESRRFYADKSDVRRIVNEAYCARVETTDGKRADFQMNRYSEYKILLPILKSLEDEIFGSEPVN